MTKREYVEYTEQLDEALQNGMDLIAVLIPNIEDIDDNTTISKDTVRELELIITQTIFHLSDVVLYAGNQDMQGLPLFLDENDDALQPLANTDRIEIIEMPQRRKTAETSAKKTKTKQAITPNKKTTKKRTTKK